MHIWTQIQPICMVRQVQASDKCGQLIEMPFRHLIFHRANPTTYVILAMYMNDIFLTRSAQVGIVETKKYLRKHFVAKTFGKPIYFLGIELLHEKNEVVLFQRRYALDLQVNWVDTCK